MPESNEAAKDDAEPEAGRSLELSTENDAAPAAENAEVQRMIELLPPEQRAQIFGMIRRESMSHSGWLPTPTFMREYEEVLPGLAERIVAMPEREQSFRHDTTRDLVKRDYRLRSTGQGLGMAALILILGFCVFLALLGFATQAAWVAGVTIVGTVGVFVAGQVTGNSSSSKDEVEAGGDGEA